MLNIEAIEINRIAIHKIDYLRDKLELSENIEMPSQGLNSYFEEQVRNILNSTTIKTGKFNNSNTTLATCVSTMLSIPTSFLEQSKIMTYWFYNNYERNNQNTVFIGIVEFTDIENENRYIAILKLDPVRSFRFSEEEGTFQQISTLPDSGKALNRAALISIYNADNKYDFLYRNQSQGKGEDPSISQMWLEGFLEGIDVPSPKHLTQLVIKETEKWISSNDDKLETEEGSALRNTVRTLAQSEELDVVEIANTTLKEDEMKVNYVNSLLEKGLPETSFAPDRQWAEKTARKVTYVCDYNVNISGSSEAINEITSINKDEQGKIVLTIETKKFTQK